MRFIVIILIVAAIAVGGYFALKSKAGQQATEGLTGIGTINTKITAERELAISAAKELWRTQKLQGADLSSGPCLSNAVIPGWVADIAHNPRTSADDKQENQCSAYRDGTAKHFVELDSSGNLIRSQ